MYRFFGLLLGLLVSDLDLGRFRICYHDLCHRVIVFCHSVLSARNVVFLVDRFTASLLANGSHCDYILVLALNDVLSQARCMEPHSTIFVATLNDEMIGVLWSFAFTYQTQRLSGVSTNFKDVRLIT